MLVKKERETNFPARICSKEAPAIQPSTRLIRTAHQTVLHNAATLCIRGRGQCSYAINTIAYIHGNSRLMMLSLDHPRSAGPAQAFARQTGGPQRL